MLGISPEGFAGLFLITNGAGCIQVVAVPSKPFGNPAGVYIEGLLNVVLY
jgi:hypothetical protein